MEAQHPTLAAVAAGRRTSWRPLAGVNCWVVWVQWKMTALSLDFCSLDHGPPMFVVAVAVEHATKTIAIYQTEEQRSRNAQTSNVSVASLKLPRMNVDERATGAARGTRPVKPRAEGSPTQLPATPNPNIHRWPSYLVALLATSALLFPSLIAVLLRWVFCRRHFALSFLSLFRLPSVVADIFWSCIRLRCGRFGVCAFFSSRAFFYYSLVSIWFVILWSRGFFGAFPRLVMLLKFRYVFSGSFFVSSPHVCRPMRCFGSGTFCRSSQY